MAVRPIVILGEPGDEILHRSADPVQSFDGSLQGLIDDMIDTVRHAPGVGLAAPQVGVSLRLVVINVPEIPAFALINGEVVRQNGRRWIEEGCLSIPGYRGNLYRSVRVTATGFDRYGRRIRIRAVDDVLAQALEHEIDHTNGLLYIDRMDNGTHLHRSRRWLDEHEAEAPPDQRPAGDDDDPYVERAVPLRKRGGRPILSRPHRFHPAGVGAGLVQRLAGRRSYRA
jgi:peptide deformylase